MMEKCVKVEIAPDAFVQQTSVRVVVNRDEKKPKAPCVQTFSLPHGISIGDIVVSSTDLVRLLWHHTRLSRTLPLKLDTIAWTSDDDDDDNNNRMLPICPNEWQDDSPHSFSIDVSFQTDLPGMPSEWPFVWNNVECFLRIQPQRILLRIQSMEPADAHRVLEGISRELYALGVRRQRAARERGIVQIYVSQDVPSVQWMSNCNRTKRSMDTVYLDATIKERTIAQLHAFFDDQPMYERCGVTHKRVILLSGKPSTGKTTFVLALASTFNYNIAKLTLTPRMDK